MSDVKLAEETKAIEAPATAKLPATKTNAGSVGVREMGGGALFMPRSMQEVMDFAQLMAKAGPAIPPAFRGQPGACLAVAMQALRWEMDPFSVAQKAYTTSDRSGNDRIAYEAQLIAAVINTRGPFEHRPTLAFEGEKDTLRCTVSATIRGEREARTIKTPRVSDITTKNSPLWKSDPEQQLSYYALRAFGRRWCPEVLLGVYSPDELQEMGPDRAMDITPPPRPKLEDFTPQTTAQPEAKKPEPELLPITEEDEREADRLTRAAIEGDETKADEGTDLTPHLNALSQCTAVASIDRLENEVGKTLASEPDKLQAWVDACAARAKEIMDKAKVRK